MLPIHQRIGLLLATILGILAILQSGRVATIDTSSSEQQPWVLNPSLQSPKLNGVSEESPLFVLSLPNSGSNSLQRYFQCAGLVQYQSPSQLGRYFVNQRPGTPKKELLEIGRCMHNNYKNHQPILKGCGNFEVWLDMDIARKSLCYFPSMIGLEAIQNQYPNATILQVIRSDASQWYETLSYELRERWPELCQANHPNVSFPGRQSPKDEWINFYHWHVNHVRKFANANPSLRYIEINLDGNDATTTARTLQKHLGVSPNCWTDSIQEPNQVGPPKPNDITYPLLLAALSKSGTTTVHDYFTCGLGAGTSIHTWTKNQTTKRQTYVGECLQYNIQHNRPLFQECSYYKVWTDVQYLTKPKGGDWSQGKCFFPTLEQNGGLQSFYQHYPHGTLVHVHRIASNWYKSTKGWMDLSERWSQACPGFPPPHSGEAEWIQFYHNHTNWVRQFARDHPSLTYVEVALEDPDTPRILEQVFGIPTHCWGTSNVNKKNKEKI